MSAIAFSRPPAWLRIVGVVALLWNLIGACFYLGQVGVLGAPFVQPDAPADMPAWVTAAYAIGVFGGAIGSLGLALRQGWARPVLLVSLVALIIDWGWVFANYGVSPLGLFVLVVAVLLLWLATSAGRKGWLR